MKNFLKNKIVVLGLVLMTVFGILSVKKQSSSHSAAAVKAIYYCPMHPSYTSDRPGQCPICHMDLVLLKPQSAAESRLPEGYGMVQIDSDKTRLIGIQTEDVKKQAIRQTVRAAGTVAHDAELYQAQAEFLQALAALHRAEEGGVASAIAQSKDLVESSRIRLQHLGLNEDLITEVSKQTAPDHGLLYAHGGGAVWVYANVYEYEVAAIKPGQTASGESPSYPGKTFTGRVRAVDPMVDMKTRTTRVRIQMENPDGLLKPDMFLTVSLGVALGDVLAVPRPAVLDTGTRKIVFVEKAEGQFEPREVVLGVAADNFYAVEQGLAEGERVVTSGNFLIDSESRLKAALQSASQGGHVHGG